MADNPFRKYVPQAYDWAKRVRELKKDVALSCGTEADQMEYLKDALEGLEKAEMALCKNYFELQIVSAG